MDIRQLIYFITIYDEMSITSAGEKLHISQPTLSNQLKLLEEELGVSLFERKNRRLFPTHEADILYSRAKILESDYDSIIEIFQDLKAGVNETLHIGCIASLAILEFPNIMSEYRKINSGCKIHVFENNTSTLISLLDEGTIDLCIVKGNVDNSIYYSLSLDSYLGTENDCLAAVGLPHQIENYRDVIAFEELSKTPLIVQRTHEVLIRQAFGVHDLTPNITSSHENIISAMTWSSHGIGVAILPFSGTKLINYVPNGEKLIVKKIINPTISTKTNLIWRKDQTLSLASEHFIKYIKGNLK